MAVAKAEEGKDANALIFDMMRFSSTLKNPEASELRGLVSDLIVAADKERDTGKAEVVRLATENAALASEKVSLINKHIDLTAENVAPRQKLERLEAFSPPSAPAATPSDARLAKRVVYMRSTASGTECDLRNGSENIQSQTPPKPATAPRTQDPRLLTSNSDDRKPDLDAHRPPKRQRTTDEVLVRRKPSCTYCNHMGLRDCDGRPHCNRCADKICVYYQCRIGSACEDERCTRFHPEQWTEKQGREIRNVERFNIRMAEYKRERRERRFR